jgi:acyl-CoA thioesterase
VGIHLDHKRSKLAPMTLDWPNRSNFSDSMGFQLVERSDGAATVRVRVETRHANTMGIAHGGLLTSVMDTACGAAVARQPSIAGKPVSTVSIQVTYLGPSFVGDTLTVRARRRGLGRRLITCDVEVENSNGSTVAIGLCTLRVRSGDGAFERRPPG